MAAILRFPFRLSTSGSQAASSSNRSKSGTSATSTNSSSFSESSLLKLPTVAHDRILRPKDSPHFQQHQNPRYYNAGLQLPTVDAYVADIYSSHRHAEVIVLERMARSGRVGLPRDVAALKLALCLYRGRAMIQRFHNAVYMQCGSVLAEGDGALYLE